MQFNVHNPENKSFLIDPQSVVFDISHRLDFLQIVANDVGLGVLLPPHDDPTTAAGYGFDLNLTPLMQRQQLKAKVSWKCPASFWFLFSSYFLSNLTPLHRNPYSKGISLSILTVQHYG